jgi:hypothetical protein
MVPGGARAVAWGRRSGPSARVHQFRPASDGQSSCSVMWGRRPMPMGVLRGRQADLSLDRCQPSLPTRRHIILTSLAHRHPIEMQNR